MPFLPKIRVKPPGPLAQRVLAKDARYLSPSYTRAYPLVVHSGRDVWIQDVDGNRYLDFTSGVGVTIAGHANPLINTAVQQQIRRFTHMCGTDFYYALQPDLAERLAGIIPGTFPKRVFFTNSGAESIEAALKLARYSTRRHRFLAFLGAFHGRTMGALSLTASKAVQRERFGPLLPEVTHALFPNPYRDIFRSGGRPGAAAIEYIEDHIFKRLAPPSDIAAVIVEPIQGEGGFVVPPDDFFPLLRALCDRHGILLVVDEVQSGLGRTGRWMAIEHFGVIPDIICLAKGIANGLPLGAMVSRADLHVWGPGSHANTFGGNPVACAAALATLDLIQKRLLANAVSMGERLASRLDRLAEKFPAIGQHRGLGLMRAIEIVKPSGAPDAALRERIVRRCFERGLLVLGCGESSVRFLPPLTLAAGHVDAAAEILGDVLQRL